MKYVDILRLDIKLFATAIIMPLASLCAFSQNVEPKDIDIDLDNLPPYLYQAKGPILVDGIYYKLYRSKELLKDHNGDYYLAAAVYPCYDISKAKTDEENLPLPGFNGNSSADPVPYYTGEVTIPETIEYCGKTFVVDALGPNSFQNSYGMTKLNLPNTIRVIAMRSFINCCRLTELNMPNTINRLEAYTFAHNGLKEFQLPDSLLELEEQLLYPRGMDFNPTALKFSPNSFVPEERYAPISNLGIQQVYNGTKILELPGTRFSLFWEYNQYVYISLVDAGYIAAYFNPTDRFASIRGALHPLSLKYIIVGTDTPPVIECPGPEMILTYGTILSPEEEASGEYVWDKYITAKEPGLFIKDENYDNLTLIVPTGSEQAYAEAPVWSKFKNIRGVANIEQYRNEDALAGLEQIVTDEESITVRGEASRILINAPEGTFATILTPDGRICQNLRTGTSITESKVLPAGLYIVRAGTHTFKTLVK